MPVVSPLPELLENRQPVIVTAHSSPSIRQDRSRSASTAWTISGKRLAQSWPLRVSRRTPAALRHVARERIATTGQRSHPAVKRLGNPNGARALRGKQVGNKEALAVIKAHAQERAQDLRAIIADVKAAGITSVRE